MKVLEQILIANVIYTNSNPSENIQKGEVTAMHFFPDIENYEYFPK